MTAPVTAPTTPVATPGAPEVVQRELRPVRRPSPRLFLLARRGGRTVELLLLTLAALVVISPVLWTISTSLRTPAESFSEPPDWVPLHPIFSNFSSVFSTVPFWRFVLNSVIVTGLIVIGQLVTSSLAGYAFARLRFRGNAAVFWVILSTMMVPIQATIIPVFILIKYLHLSDTLTALIIPVVASAFGTFLMRQAFLQMPKEYGEAARVDGASHWRVFTRIYMPMAWPALATLAVLAFAGYWNEFFRPLIFLNSQNNYTLPLGLVTLQGYMGTGSVSVVLAAVVLALIPNLIVFGAAQKYFARGISFGGVKG
jgi:multiple sugar transport system permease protein